MVIKNSFAQIPYPGITPGKATITAAPDSSILIGNNVLMMEFRNFENHTSINRFENRETQNQLDLNHQTLFKLIFANGSILTSDDFSIQNKPEVLNIPSEPEAMILAKRSAGKKLVAELVDKKSEIKIHWEVLLRDNANYIRQFMTINTKDSSDISKIVMLELPADAKIEKKGVVDGSPLANKNMFFALEHPMGQTEADNGHLTQFMLQLSPFVPGISYTISTVWGVTPVNQLRRGFLYYVEQERSTPYHQVLHYNSWYDISWDGIKFTESQALDRIGVYRDSLFVRRKVALDAFLFDDGWDDDKTLWQFNKNGFPDGFENLKKEAQSVKSSLGVWMSPFGGYGAAKEKRIEYGETQSPPFEINDNGFSLSGPVYYQRFLGVAGKFIKDYDIVIFKFDGVGPGNDASGAGIRYHSDIEAFLKLLKELKKIKPSLYLDLTTGTWPSVYWLFYGDNTWRSGDDNGLAGEGPMRQQGITYRDANTYKNVVKAGPLYPLTALMNGGLIIGDHGLPSKFEMDGKDISDDLWSFFGTGVSLQELYVNPHKLGKANGDCLANAIRWARENEKIMTDTHWVGGDPGKGEVYGYASWSEHKALLMLRNPSGAEKSFQVNTKELFEIPGKMKHGYLFFDARTGDGHPVLRGADFRLSLKPFEVKVFNCLPD